MLCFFTGTHNGFGGRFGCQLIPGCHSNSGADAFLYTQNSMRIFGFNDVCRLDDAVGSTFCRENFQRIRITDRFERMVIDDAYIRLLCLVLARIVPLSAFSPALGARLFDPKCRLGIAFILAVVITSAVHPAEISEFWVAIVVQAIVGIVLALFSMVPFYAIQSIGEWIDLHRGETLSSVLIPQMQSRTSSLGRLYLLLSTAIFFACDGHLTLVSELIASFKVIPVHRGCGSNLDVFQLLPGLNEWNRLIADLFFVTLKFAIPTVFCLWVTDIVLGILNRTAPTLQVFFLGIPLKMWLGVGITGVVIGYSIEPIVKYILVSMALFT